MGCLMNELFPLEKEKERCWYCEREIDDLIEMDDGAYLCPECRELKQCDDCGNMVSILYGIEDYNDSLCLECFFIGLTKLEALI
jgi:hypothetical protein